MTVSPNYFHRLTLRQTAVRAFEVFVKRDNPTVFLSLSAVFLVPFIAIMATSAFYGATLLADGRSHTDEESTNPPRFNMKYFITLLGLVGYEMILHVTITVIGQGSMIRAVADTYLGARPEVLACLNNGKRLFWVLLCSVWILFLAAVVGALVPALFFGLALLFDSAWLGLVGFLFALAFLVGCIYVLVCTSLVFPSIVVENKSALGGIKRSLELASGRWCYIFCTIFWFIFAERLVLSILCRVFLGSDLLAVFSVKGVIVAFAPSIVSLPMLTILYTVLYFNLRIETEDFDAVVLSRDLGTSSAEGAYKALPLVEN